MEEYIYPKNTGYVESELKNIPRYADIFAGGSDLKASKDWRSFMPKFKYQDWIPACVAFAHRGIVYSLNKAYDKLLDDLSPIWLFFFSGGTKQGSSITITGDTLRKTGSVYEKGKPFPNPNKYSYDTWEELKSYALDITQEVLDESKDNKIKSFSSVNVNDKALMIDALEYSPLIIIVEVIKEYWNGVYHPEYEGKGSKHAVILEHIDSNGKYHIFDSLQPKSNFDGHHVLNADWKIYYAFSYRDLPNNWKEVQANVAINLDPRMNDSIETLIKNNKILNSTDTNNMFWYFYNRVANKAEIAYWVNKTSQTLYKAMEPNAWQFKNAGYYNDVISKIV